MKKVRVIVFVGLLICMEIILTRFLPIQTPIVRISFGFLPIALASILFGPVIGGAAAALCDILGMMIFPRGAYFPGLTFSALLTGSIYGLFLYRKPKSVFRIALAVLTVTVIPDLILNTIWLSMLTGNPAAAILIPRLIKSAVMFPIQVFTIHIMWQYAGSFIQRNYLGEGTKSKMV